MGNERYYNPDEPPEENELTDRLNEDQLTMFEDEYSANWRGMPDFTHTFDDNVFQEVIVRCRDEAAFIRLQELLEQTMTRGTKSVYYPKVGYDERRFNRWVPDEDT
jgi:hypothetical protein